MKRKERERPAEVAEDLILHNIRIYSKHHGSITVCFETLVTVRELLIFLFNLRPK